MKKFTTGLVALLFTAATLTGCDVLGNKGDTPKEDENQENVPTTVAVTGVTLGAAEINLYVDGTTTLNAEVAPQNATNKNVTWASDNETVATVVGGVVTAKAVGVANITVTTVDGNKTASCKINVSEKPVDVVSVESISLDKETLTLTAGETATLAATVSPENATNKAFTWSSSDPSVATIANGLVTAVSAGTATIKATTSDGGKQASCVVTVNPKQTEFPKTVVSGDTIDLDGTGYSFATGSNADEVIHISEEGGKTVVYGIKGGVATLQKGENTYPITVKLNASLISVGTAHSAYSTRATNMPMAQGVESLKFTVGSKNKFIPQFIVTADSFNKTTWEEDDLDVELLDIGNSFVTKPTLSINSSYGTVNDDFSINFSEAAIGQDVTLTLSVGSKSASTVVHVVEGYNAHTHEEFKSLFEDTSVGGTINVVRNIESTLSRDRFFEDPAFTAPDGSHMFPNNLYEGGHTKDENGKITSGSVYDRHFNDNEDANDIEINGNFLEMNARSVPDHVPSLLGGQRTPYGNQENLLPNNAEGLFYITAPHSSGHDVVIRNLYAKGNSDRANADTELNSEAVIGAYGIAGCSFDRAAVEFVNSQFDHFERGVYMVFENAKLKVTNSVIKDTWGPSCVIYCATSVDVVHSTFTNAGGPIFFINGNIDNVPGQAQTAVSWDVTSNITNFVSTNTSWCKANGLSGVGQGLQAIDDAVSGAGLTILNSGKFNFIYVSMTNQADAPTGVTYRPVKDLTIKNGDTALVEAKESASNMPTDTTASVIPSLASAFGGSFISPLGQTYAQMDASIALNVYQLLGGDMVALAQMDPATQAATLAGYLQTAAGLAEPNRTQVMMGAFGGALTDPLTQLALSTGHMYFDVSYNIGEVAGANYGYLTAVIEVMQKAQA